MLAKVDSICAQQDLTRSQAFRRTPVQHATLTGQGKRAEALNLAKPVHEWFTEGFKTRDLKEANALLDELV